MAEEQIAHFRNGPALDQQGKQPWKVVVGERHGNKLKKRIRREIGITVLGTFTCRQVRVRRPANQNTW